MINKILLDKIEKVLEVKEMAQMRAKRHRTLSPKEIQASS